MNQGAEGIKKVEDLMALKFRQRLTGRIQNVASFSREKMWGISGSGCRISSVVILIAGGGQVTEIAKL